MKNIKLGDVFGYLVIIDDIPYDRYYYCQCICENIKLIRKDHLIHNETQSCGCKKIQLTLSTKPKKYDTTFLNNPTELMAYFLGLFMADGWVDQNGNVYIAQKNKKLIQDIASATKYENKIIKIVADTIYGKAVSYRLHYGREVKEKMKEYGFTNKKTGNEFIPQCLTNDVFHHFLRGLFDGDGTIGITKRAKLSASSIISASKLFLENILNYLRINNIVITNRAKITERMGQNKPCYRLRLGHIDTIKLCDYMYNNASIKLDYKYEIYQQAKKYIVIDNRWRTEEIEMIKNNIRPPNRDERAIIALKYKLRKNGILPPIPKKLITFNNKTMTLKEWSNELKIKKSALYRRIYVENWSVERAFTTPIKNR